jgi:hypothetical protein
MLISFKNKRLMATQPDFNQLSVFPNIVNVNVLKGECPCRCVHCPVGIVKPERRAEHFGKQTMNVDLFKQLAMEIAKHKHAAIRIHAVGEPLLWSDLDVAVRFLGQHQIKSWIFTCAITHDRNLLRSLCEHVSIIEVSVNAINREEYLATKGIDAFDRVAGNIGYMSNYIKANRLPARLLLSRVQTDDENTDKQFKVYWTEKKVAADVFIRSYHNYNNLLDIRGASNLKKPCLVHWARASIDCDGTMVCCFNELFKPYMPDVILGKIDQTTSIQQIWQNEKLRQIRTHDQSGDFSGLKYRIPCENCKTCQPVDTLRDTSEKQLMEIDK